MKVTIIGCGGSGAAIAELLIRFSSIKTISLVDSTEYRLNKLERALTSLNKNIEIIKKIIDATNEEEIMSSIKGSKVVINSASPICNIPIMKACIKSKSNYIDLASDPFEYPGIDKNTTFSEQLKLDNQFKENNLIALPNCGFSPGFTDILVKSFIEEENIKRINKIVIHFGEKINSTKPVFSWSPYTVLLETLFSPTIYKNGDILELENINGWKEIDFGKDIGKIKVRIFSGHPELKTIPKYSSIPIDYIEIGGGMILNEMQLPEIIMDALSRRVSKTTLIDGDILSELSKEFYSPDLFVENHLAGLIENEFFSGKIELTGETSNSRITCTYLINENLKGTLKKFTLSSVGNLMVSFMPVAIIELILKDELKKIGVMPPILLNNPTEILSKIKQNGLIVETIKKEIK